MPLHDPDTATWHTKNNPCRTAGIFIVRYLAGKKEQILTKEDITEYLALALISIILIVIAAWIEANVTLKIAKAMLNSTKGI
ncbi:hypothetical protein [Geoglobus acetivorans]|uniref:Uncharacterized protein n=1 Tax=Geoglobus acetivorans TaxID=565033 RepID=A0ABZ3H5Z4_GEOAI|nr:hypothetical protein [Geoglobus acetivorans]